MIEIKYGGGNSFSINNSKDSIIINPNRELVELKNIIVKDKIEVVTEDQYLTREGSKLLIDTPGEYEVGPFSIKGISAKKYSEYDNKKEAIIYSIDSDNINIGVLGDVKPDLNDDELEYLGIIDVLFLPVGGGGYTMYAKEAVKLARQIEPKIIILTTFGDKIKYPVSLDDIDVFEKEMGVKIESEKILKIKSQKDLPENFRVIKLDQTL